MYSFRRYGQRLPDDTSFPGTPKKQNSKAKPAPQFKTTKPRGGISLTRFLLPAKSHHAKRLKDDGSEADDSFLMDHAQRSSDTPTSSPVDVRYPFKEEHIGISEKGRAPLFDESVSPEAEVNHESPCQETEQWADFDSYFHDTITTTEESLPQVKIEVTSKHEKSLVYYPTPQGQPNVNEPTTGAKESSQEAVESMDLRTINAHNSTSPQEVFEDAFATFEDSKSISNLQNDESITTSEPVSENMADKGRSTAVITVDEMENVDQISEDGVSLNNSEVVHEVQAYSDDKDIDLAEVSQDQNVTMQGHNSLTDDDTELQSNVVISCADQYSDEDSFDVETASETPAAVVKVTTEECFDDSNPEQPYLSTECSLEKPTEPSDKEHFDEQQSMIDAIIRELARKSSSENVSDSSEAAHPEKVQVKDIVTVETGEDIHLTPSTPNYMDLGAMSTQEVTDCGVEQASPHPEATIDNQKVDEACLDSSSTRAQGEGDDGNRKTYFEEFNERAGRAFGQAGAMIDFTVLFRLFDCDRFGGDIPQEISTSSAPDKKDSHKAGVGDIYTNLSWISMSPSEVTERLPTHKEDANNVSLLTSKNTFDSNYSK